MMIELHRFSEDDQHCEDRISIESSDIRQVHEGRGGVTIITTPMGKIPVEETYEQVIAMKNSGISGEW